MADVEMKDSAGSAEATKLVDLTGVAFA